MVTPATKREFREKGIVEQVQKYCRTIPPRNSLPQLGVKGGWVGYYLLPLYYESIAL